MRGQRRTVLTLLMARLETRSRHVRYGGVDEGGEGDLSLCLALRTRSERITESDALW